MQSKEVKYAGIPGHHHLVNPGSYLLLVFETRILDRDRIIANQKIKLSVGHMTIAQPIYNR